MTSIDLTFSSAIWLSYQNVIVGGVVIGFVLVSLKSEIYKGIEICSIKR
jgi:hypothetical protein